MLLLLYDLTVLKSILHTSIKAMTTYAVTSAILLRSTEIVVQVVCSSILAVVSVTSLTIPMYPIIITILCHILILITSCSVITIQSL